jgi:predicted alpha/beta-hydrolase family hydrolase
VKSWKPIAATVLLVAASLCLAQPAGVTLEMINTTLPEEGAPKAVPGAYAVTTEPAFGNLGLITLRPTDLAAFPQRDKLPVVVWGHGGCALDSPRFYGFLGTIASHGFLVITSAAIEPRPPGVRTPPITADHLKAAIAWAAYENERANSPLRGKIDLQQVAAMGQSCGGILAIALGLDPRVDTIVVFNGGVEPPNPVGPPSDRPTTESLKNLHGPVLFVDGHERDFAMRVSRSTYDAIKHLPAFYASRHGGGHLSSFYHAGGGEMANVASSWVRWQFKGDKEAAKMFVGKKCGLCTNPDWDTAAKRLKK